MMTYDTDKINRLVAEKVMGKKVRWLQPVEPKTTIDPSAPLGFTDNFGGSEWCQRDRERYVNCWWDDDEGAPCPDYTADMNHAVEVVEKMRERLGPTCFGLLSSSVDYKAVFIVKPGRNHYAYGPAPLAICLAALKAVGVDISELSI